MARTTATLVGQIIDVDQGDSLVPFIDSANELVTEYCTGEKGPDTPYPTKRLELIERWLAAHFYAIYKPRRESERADVVAQKFKFEIGLNLAQTREGQQAMTLDTNGGLATLNKQTETGGVRSPSLTWLGTESPRKESY